MWWIITIVVIVSIGFGVIHKKNRNNKLSANNNVVSGNNETNPQIVDIYKEITGVNEYKCLRAYFYIKNKSNREETISISFFENVPTKDNYGTIDEQSGYTEIDVLLKFLFPKIYLAYLKYEMFSITADEVEEIIKRLHLDMQHFVSKSGNEIDTNSAFLASDRGLINYIVNKFIIPYANNLMQKECRIKLFNDFGLDFGFVNVPSFLTKQIQRSYDTYTAWCYEPTQPDVHSVVNWYKEGEKLHYYRYVFIRNVWEVVVEKIPSLSDSANNDLRQIHNVQNRIFNKMEYIFRFNNTLQKTINLCEEKANKAVIVTYGKLLLNSGISKKQYFRKYDKINHTYSSQLSPIVVASCDATIKKIGVLIKQKQEILDKNNVDIVKYQEMLHKLDRQIVEEEQLQKIKAINKDINKFDSEADIVKNEEKNLEFENMIEDINRMEVEVNERRNYEIQFGVIEI